MKRMGGYGWMEYVWLTFLTWCKFKFTGAGIWLGFGLYGIASWTRTDLTWAVCSELNRISITSGQHIEAAVPCIILYLVRNGFKARRTHNQQLTYDFLWFGKLGMPGLWFMFQGVHGTFFGASLGKGYLKFGKPDSLGHLATSPQQLGPVPVDLCILPHALELTSVLQAKKPLW